MSKILIIGATQGTGEIIVRLLLKQSYDVRIFARNKEKAYEKFGEEVEIIIGDLQNPTEMPEAVKDIDHIIFTAGVTKRPCSEELIVKTEFEGIKKILQAAKDVAFNGNFLFLSSIGVTKRNWISWLLNKVKGNALKWRFEMENEIRKSGFGYTIVRAGFLMNGEAGNKPVELSQNQYPLYLRYRIARADVAKIFVEALTDENANRKTFDAVWGKKKRNLNDMFASLKEDKIMSSESTF